LNVCVRRRRYAPCSRAGDDVENRVDDRNCLRISHLLGAGAFVSTAAGDYLSAGVDSPCSKGAGLATVFNRTDGAIHLWMSIGARVVLLP
jgi:hypothetical protein